MKKITFGFRNVVDNVEVDYKREKLKAWESVKTTRPKLRKSDENGEAF